MIKTYLKCFGPEKWLLILIFLSISAHTFSQTGNDLLTAWTGTINQTNLQVSNLPSNGKVIQLTSAITVSAGATFKVLNGTTAVPAQSTLNSSFIIEVTAQNGAKKNYTMTMGAAMVTETVSNVNTSVSAITNKMLSIGGISAYHITSTVNPLQGSFLNLTSGDVWLYFDNIKPSVFNSKYLDHIAINGQRAIIDSTVRLVQYLQGSVIISHSSAYQPLQIFNAQNQAGSNMKLNLYTYYRAPQLGALNNTVASFSLKKGYMATFAENENGTGFSKVYVAAENDIIINSLPNQLKGRISFIRVFPWRWVTKKGWTNSQAMADTLGAKWRYNWNNSDESTLDAEYVPIRQTQWWPGLPNTKKNVNHLLGFNEPNSAEQSNLTPNQAIAAWPALMESGLRLGSPAITDGGANWLYSFIDKADSAGLRVDFVAVHFYRGCQSVSQFYNFLKSIHTRTRRPIWITEWNNGANWTTSPSCPKPTYQQQATAIGGFLNMLDTAGFVERHALYEWVEDTRKMFLSENPIVLNPAGVIYRDKVSPTAYAASREYDPYPPRSFTQGNLALVRFGNPAVAQSGANPIFIDEYSPTGSLVQSIPLPTVTSGVNRSLVSSTVPTANSDGLLSISPDGTKISLAGYNTTVGSTSTNNVAATTTPRGVAIIDARGNINTASSFNDLVSGHVVRGAVVNNTSRLYMTGGSSNGMRTALIGNGTTTSSASVFVTPGGTKKTSIYGGDIYFTQNTAGLAKVYKLTGNPTAAASPVPLPGIPAAAAATQATGFVLFDVNTSVGGYDLLYFADETPSPVIHKYTFDGSVWTSRGSYSITGLTDNTVKDLTGTLVNGVPNLYGVTFTSAAKFVDNAAYISTISITKTNLINNALSSNSAFRGISFAPGTAVKTVFTPPAAFANLSQPDLKISQLLNTGQTLKSTIYPNPATGSSFFLKLASGLTEQHMVIKIADLSGRVVHTANFPKNYGGLVEITLPASIITGVYSVSVNEKYVSKLLVQK